jgi:hypothetical protein
VLLYAIRENICKRETGNRVKCGRERKNTKRVQKIYSEEKIMAESVRYHSGGSMKLNACILLLAHMVYL